MSRYFLILSVLGLFCLSIFCVYWWFARQKLIGLPVVFRMISYSQSIDVNNNIFKVYGKVTSLDGGVITIEGVRKSDKKIGKLKLNLAGENVIYSNKKWKGLNSGALLPDDAGIVCARKTTEMTNIDAGFYEILDLTDYCSGIYSAK